MDTLKTARVRGPRQYVLVAEALRTTSEAALVLVDRIPPALLGSGVAPCLSLGAVRSSSVERRVKVTSEDSEGGAMPENEVNTREWEELWTELQGKGWERKTHSDQQRTRYFLLPHGQKDKPSCRVGKYITKLTATDGSARSVYRNQREVVNHVRALQKTAGTKKVTSGSQPEDCCAARQNGAAIRYEELVIRLEQLIQDSGGAELVTTDAILQLYQVHPGLCLFECVSCAEAIECCASTLLTLSPCVMCVARRAAQDTQGEQRFALGFEDGDGETAVRHCFAGAVLVAAQVPVSGNALMPAVGTARFADLRAKTLLLG